MGRIVGLIVFVSITATASPRFDYQCKDSKGNSFRVFADRFFSSEIYGVFQKPYSGPDNDEKVLANSFSFGQFKFSENTVLFKFRTDIHKAQTAGLECPDVSLNLIIKPSLSSEHDSVMDLVHSRKNTTNGQCEQWAELGLSLSCLKQ